MAFISIAVKMKVFFLPLVLLLLQFTSSIYGQDWEWARYANTVNEDECTDVVVDPATGEVYSTGYFTGTLDEFSLVTSSQSGYIAKHNTSGNLIWSFAIYGSGSAFCNGITADTVNHDIYVTGGFSGIISFAGTSGLTASLTSFDALPDIFIAKYDSNGVLQWVEKAGKQDNDVGNKIVFDHVDNEVYVAGYFERECDFDGGSFSLDSDDNSKDLFVARYASSTGAFVWAISNSSGNLDEEATNISTDSASIFITGFYESGDFKVNGTSGEISIGSFFSGDSAAFVIRMRKTDGDAIWGTGIGDINENDAGFAVVSDSNRVYVVGEIGYNPFVGILPVGNSGGGTDAFIGAFKLSTGIPEWFSMLGHNQSGPNDLDKAFDIEIDRFGSLYVTGFFNDSLAFPNNVAPVEIIAPVGSEANLFVASFNSDGSYNWVLQGGGTARTVGKALSVYRGSSLYIGGYYSTGASLFNTSPTTSLPHQGNSDALLAKITPLCNLSIDLNLGQDTFFCAKDSHLLSPGLIGTYLWSTGDTTPSIFIKDSGGYSVFVTDSNGCTQKDSINISKLLPPIFDLGADTSLCPGDTMATGAGGYAAWNWSTTDTLDSIAIFSPGVYHVTVSDTNGCQNADTITVDLYPVNIDLGSDTMICSGDSITITAGTEYATYLWSTGESSDSITLSIPGIYDIIVEDTNSCNQYDTIALTYFPPISLNLGNDSFLCIGDTFILDAGPGFTSYAWSSGGTSPTIEVTSAGMYSVTVTDPNGCSGVDSLLLTSIPLPTVDLGTDTSLCPGDTILIGVEGFASWNWSTGETIDSIAIFSPGVYHVTVADTNGCQNADTIAIGLFPVNIDLGVDTLFCLGDSITLTAGSIYASYLWSTGESTDSITISIPGIYDVIVEDTNGCNQYDTIAITYFPPVSLNLGNDSILCTEDTLTLHAGAGFTSYVWATGETSPMLEATSSGVYAVTVTNSDGCSGADSILLTFIPLPTVDLGSDSIFCLGDSIFLDAGTGFVSYDWNSGATTSAIWTATTGYHEVTVIDLNGCSTTEGITLSIPTVTPVDLGPDTSYCGLDSLLLNGGTGYISYTWSTGESTNIIWVHSTGEYSIGVIDPNGCMAHDTIIIDLHPAIPVDIGPDTSICLGDSLFITPTVGYESWEWNSGATSSGIWVSTAGLHTVTVTDTLTCSGIGSMELTLTSPPTVHLGADTSICTGDSLLLDADNAGASYLWSTGETSQTLWALTPGSYSVTVTLISSCAASASIEVSSGEYEVNVFGLEEDYCEGAETIDLIGMPAGGIFTGPFVSPTGTFSPTLASVSTSVTYTYTFPGGCEISQTESTSIHSLPSAFAGDDQTISLSNLSTLTASELDPGTTGLWEAIASPALLSSPTLETSQVTGLQNGINLFRWTTSNGLCSASDEVSLMVVPFENERGFSPNGDGVNDLFVFEGLENFPGSQLVIYTRWSSRIFAAQDYKNDWDGRNQVGEALPDDTYYFSLTLSEGTFLKGFVILQR